MPENGNGIDRLTDRDLLALTLVGEARGESLSGMVAVAQVVQNRTKEPARFGATWRDVILAKKQFSCWNVTDPNRALLERLAAQLVNGSPLGPHQASVVEAIWVADGVMNRRVRDLVQGSCHYHERSVHPSWAKGITPTVAIGHHLFFAGIA